MLRNLLLRLLCGAALTASAALFLPALSRPAAEKEEGRPLGKVSPDLALVPPDALWFVSARPADLMKHPGLKALRELPEVAPAFPVMKRYMGVSPEEIERVTAVARRLLGPGDPHVYIVRTVKPHDKAAVRKAAPRVLQESKIHGKDVVIAGYDLAFWSADDRTFVFGSLPALVPYLAVVGKPAKTHPLADELKEADGKHAVTAGILPSLAFRHRVSWRGWPKRDFRPSRDKDSRPGGASKEEKKKAGTAGEFVGLRKGDEKPRFKLDEIKDEPIELEGLEQALLSEGERSPLVVVLGPLLRCRRALVTVDTAPKGAKLKVEARLTFASEDEARDGETAADWGRITLREVFTVSEARRKGNPILEGMAPLSAAFRGAKLKRTGKSLAASLEAEPDPVVLFRMVASGPFGGPGPIRRPPREPKDKREFKDR